MDIQQILVASEPTEIERLAAATLQDCCRRIGHRDIPVKVVDGMPLEAVADGSVLVGLPSSHPMIHTLLEQHRMPDPASLTPEGFVLTTVTLGHGKALVITGQDGKGVLNGVYDFLQDTLGVGFFRDGMRLPEATPLTVSERLTVSDLRVVESPRHAIRGELLWGYPGPQRFCSSTWPLETWQRIIDWQAQKKMNTIELEPPLGLIFPLAFPELDWPWGGPWEAGYTRDYMCAILDYGRSRGIKFMYEVWYSKMANTLRQAYPDLIWHDHFLCASQPECADFSRRIWQAAFDVFGTDHLYTIRYRGEEGMPYSPVCGELPKWEGYLQAFNFLREIDPAARVSAWSWAETPEELWPRFPTDFECQHMKHRLHGEWRFPGLGRFIEPGRPPIPEDRAWYNANFLVFSGTETKLLTNLSDSAYLIDDARLSDEDDACDGYMIWPEWTNTSYYLWDLMAELAWNPAAVDLDTHTRQYATLRYGPGSAPKMSESLSFVHRAGRARYISTPSRRNVVLWHMSSAHMDQMRSVYRAVCTAAETMEELKESALYAVELLDMTAYYLYQLGWYFEAQAVYHHQEAIKALDRNSDEEARHAQADLKQAGRQALKAWDALADVYRPRDDYSLQYAAEGMRGAGPVMDGFVDWFIAQSTEYYHGYPLCSSREEVTFFLRPQCEQLLLQLDDAVAQRSPYDGGERARWYWYDFPKEWKALVYGTPFPDPEVFRTRFRDALAHGRRLLPEADDTPVQALQRVIATLPDPDDLPVYDLV